MKRKIREIQRTGKKSEGKRQNEREWEGTREGRRKAWVELKKGRYTAIETMMDMTQKSWIKQLVYLQVMSFYYLKGFH